MNIFENHTSYVNYWRDLVSRYTPIGHSESEPHFTRIIDSSGSPFQPYYMVDEFMQKVIHDLKPPYFLLESFREQGYGESKNKQSTYHCGFIVLERTEDLNDFDSINDTVNSAGRHARQILAKAEAELKIDDSQCFLSWNSVMIHKVGPVSDELYGCRIDFKITRPSKTKYCVDDEVWA